MDTARPPGAGAGANELVRRRLEKLDALRAGGTDPFGQRFAFTHWSGDLVRRYHTAGGGRAQAGGAGDGGGRVVALRHHGKTCFAHLRDQSGQIQLYARQDALGDRYPAFTDLDVGDFIGVTGELFRTRTGELTVAVREFVFLAKAIRPLPEKWHGLKDVETRYRRRYVDLVMNPEVREAFVVKSRLIRAVRAFLDARGFLEVETPMMQPIPAERPPSPSSLTTMRSTWRSTSGSPPSSISSGWWWAGSIGSTRSTGTSATRGCRPSTIPSSPCSSSTRPTPTTRTSWPSPRRCSPI
jgi:lysyl-tRNA synthetase class 2